MLLLCPSTEATTPGNFRTVVVLYPENAVQIRNEYLDLSQFQDGLVSTRERVLHLGGEITIDSQPSRGARLHVRVPILETTAA